MIITFWSPGRSGATTVAAACAAALASGLPGNRRRWWHLRRSPDRPPLRVHAADLNRLAPDLGAHLGLFPPRRPADHCLSRLLPALAGGRLDAAGAARHLLPAPGFPDLKLLAGCYDPWAAARLREEHLRGLIPLLAAGADVLVLDAGPQLDCPAAFTALEMADRIVLVAGPTAPERFHARRYLLALRELGWGARVCVAMSRAPFAGRQGRPALRGAVGPGQVAAELAAPVAAAVPELEDLPVLLEEGRPAFLAATGPAGEAFRAAVQALCAVLLGEVRSDAVR